MTTLKEKKVAILLITMLTLIALVLVACSGGEAAAPAAEAPAAEEEPVAEDVQEDEAAAPAAESVVVDEVVEAKSSFQIGIMQIASHPALDAEREGVLASLAAAGFVEGANLTVDAQNAEGDIATLSTIAQKFVDDEVNLIVTISTPAIQAALNATKDIKGPPLVFVAVTDPYAAGIATAPDDHPAWVIGLQALPPVADAMAMIEELVPGVQKVGIVWNPAEKNSEVATKLARETATEMGIELLEANVADSSEIQTAAESLIAQDIEAFFISTDSTVVSGFEALVKVANENQIPLFANDPASAKRGAVAALGLDYYQDGLDGGKIAASILAGEADPADLTIERQRAGSLAVNLDAAQAQGVKVPGTVLDRATQVFGEAEAIAAIEGNFTIGLMKIATHPVMDEAQRGTLQALTDNGIIEGKNLTIISQNAEGDIATLSIIAQSFVDAEVDMIIASSTPAGQAAYQASKDLEAPPIIFNVVIDPFAAGLATTPDDHDHWITGAQAVPLVEDAMTTMLEIVPQAKIIGIIWNPSEKNSEVATGLARKAAEKLGIELLEGNVSDSSEIQTAAEALVAQGIDAFFISTDSTVVSGFEALTKVANENQIPLFANDPASAARGAAAAVGVDYFQNGYDSGLLAVKILKGEAIAGDLPIETRKVSLLHINYDAARVQGVEFSTDIEERAAATIGEK